jgi:2'-5' RNA ligase
VTARLFVAVRPPVAVVEALGPGVRPDLHVTLRFLGGIDDALVEQVDADLRAGLAGVGVCEAVVGTSVHRLGQSALVLPVSGLEDLAAAVRAAVGRYGGDDRPFRGHLTIARRRRGVPAPDVDGPAEPVRWRVEEVALVRSELGRGPGGTARHVEVAVVPLGGS